MFVEGSPARYRENQMKKQHLIQRKHQMRIFACHEKCS